MAAKRIQKEIIDFYKDPPDNCSIIQIDEKNIFEYLAIIIGPAFTPYENGIFYLKIIYPNNYCLSPPKCIFLTKIYHPNINSNGNISLDILRDQWSPALTIQKILLSISYLLDAPNNDDPLDPEIGKLYKSNKIEYYKKAREYAEKYADAPKDHELYYLEGELRIDYELANFSSGSYIFLINKTSDKYMWKAKINYKDENNIIFIDFDINFPQDYPWAPPKLTFHSNFKSKILNGINKKLKTLWNVRFFIKDVLDWIYDCLSKDQLTENMHKKNKIEEKTKNLTYLLLKEKLQNKLLLEKIEFKEDNSFPHKKFIKSQNDIVIPKKNMNEIIDIQSNIKLLNELDLYIIVNKEIGINNLGNTCYINSCLQILIHCPLFISQLLTKKYLCNNNSPFTNHFLYICWQMKNATEQINISLFKNLIGNYFSIFQGQRQNDSQEFCRKLLERMKSELNEVGNIAPYKDLSNSFSKPKFFRYLLYMEYLREKEKSIITDLFYFIILPTLKCECGYENYPFQQMLDIPLLIPENTNNTSIYNLLKNFFKKEIVERNCEKCKKRSKNIQLTKIAKPPEILNLCIQRFKDNQQKDQCFIEFLEILDLTEFIDYDLEYKGETTYFLFGIINHEGIIEFGHYYSYVKIKNNDWYEFNDSEVKKLNIIDYNSSNVYSLFYLKVK